MSVHQIGEFIVYLMFLVALVAPIRIAIIAYVVMCSIDTPGFGNIIKILIIPLILLLRFRYYSYLSPTSTVDQDKGKHRKIKHAYIYWIILTVYSALAITWSQTGNYEAGIKFVYYMIGMLFFYLVLKGAHQRNLLDTRFLTAVVVISLLLAVLQTYVLPQQYGREFSRFTGFMASQPFASFLVGLLTLVIWHAKYKIGTKMILCSVLLTAIGLNGSRTWFIGASVVLLVYFFLYSKKSALRMGSFFLIMSASIIAFYGFYNYAIQHEEQLRNTSRIFELFYTVFNDKGSTSEGTIGFREIMNAGMIAELKTSAIQELFFGHGTSSSEYVARIYHSYQYSGETIDANRVAHNEWLRILYEFGFFGFTIWMLFLISCLSVLFKQGTVKWPLLSYSGGVVLSLTTENILTSAGSVGLCGLMILLVTRKSVGYFVHHSELQTASLIICTSEKDSFG